MRSTQDFLPIEDIRDDLVFLKNGNVSMIITTSAVNFALLFETEQISIIESFAGFLNSLSFPIQIIIRSKRLDVSSYLLSLDKVLKQQPNPLLSELTRRYKKFVESLIKENDVLDKKFYVCISVSHLELGMLTKSPAEKLKKALTILMPRRDHVLRQLSRIGLKTKQLETADLVVLFHDIYNPIYGSQAHDFKPLHTPQPKPVLENEDPITSQIMDQQRLTPDQKLGVAGFNSVSDIPQTEVFQAPAIEVARDNTQIRQPQSRLESAVHRLPGLKNVSTPFVVEELIDDIWPRQSNS